MGILPLDQLTVGLVVGSNVCDASGRVLLAKGSAITDRHLRIFKTWGVTEVDIVAPKTEDAVAGTSAEGSSMPTFPKSMEPFCKKAEFLFQHSDLTHPAVQQLFAVCVHRLSLQKPEENKRGR